MSGMWGVNDEAEELAYQLDQVQQDEDEKRTILLIKLNLAAAAVYMAEGEYREAFLQVEGAMAGLDVLGIRRD